MKFTMDIPVGVITPGEFQTAEAVKAMAQAMETAGVDACYVTDHPAPRRNGCMPMAMTRSIPSLRCRSSRRTRAS